MIRYNANFSSAGGDPSTISALHAAQDRIRELEVELEDLRTENAALKIELESCQDYLSESGSWDLDIDGV